MRTVFGSIQPAVFGVKLQLLQKMASPITHKSHQQHQLYHFQTMNGKISMNFHVNFLFETAARNKNQHSKYNSI